MFAEVIQNTERLLGDFMRSELNGADRFGAASAFLNSDGLAHILPAMQRILSLSRGKSASSMAPIFG